MERSKEMGKENNLINNIDEVTKRKDIRKENKKRRGNKNEIIQTYDETVEEKRKGNKWDHEIKKCRRKKGNKTTTLMGRTRKKTKRNEEKSSRHQSDKSNSLFIDYEVKAGQVWAISTYCGFVDMQVRGHRGLVHRFGARARFSPDFLQAED